MDSLLFQHHGSCRIAGDHDVRFSIAIHVLHGNSLHAAAQRNSALQRGNRSEIALPIVFEEQADPVVVAGGFNLGAVEPVLCEEKVHLAVSGEVRSGDAEDRRILGLANEGGPGKLATALIHPGPAAEFVGLVFLRGLEFVLAVNIRQAGDGKRFEGREF